MSVAVTAPLTISQVLDRGFQLFKRTVPRLWPLTLLAALLGVLPAILFSPHKTDTGTTIGHPGAMLGMSVLTIILSMSVTICVIRVVDDVGEERNRLSLADAYFGGLRWMPTYLGATILFGMVVALASLLLLIPGIILLMSLSFYAFLIVLEDAGPSQCLKQSHRLVWGNWWRWSAIMTVVIVVFVGFYIMFGMLAGLLAHFVSGADAQMSALIAQSVVQVIVTTVATPLLYSVQLIGFRDLQLRKGGADLAARIAQAA